MTTLVINGNGTAVCVVSGDREKNSVVSRAAQAGFVWVASSRIPDPQNPSVFIKRGYRMHFKRKIRK